MNKEKFNSFLDTVEEKAQIIGGKVSNQKHLSAIRDAFASFIPFIIVGSFGILLNSVFIQPNSLLATIAGTGKEGGEDLYASWEAVSLYLSPLFTGITMATMDFFAIYISILLGYFLAESYGDNKMFGGLIGLACFLALQPTAAISGNPLSYFNSTGILFALVAGLIGPTIFHHVSTSEKLKVKMPEGVPPAISDSFNVLFPVMITIILFAAFQPIWGAFAYGVGFGKDEIAGTYSFGINVQFNYYLTEGGNPNPGTYTFIIEPGDTLYQLIPLYNQFGIIQNPEFWGGLTSDSDIWKIEIDDNTSLGEFLQIKAEAGLLANNSTWFAIEEGTIKLSSASLEEPYVIFTTDNFTDISLQNGLLVVAQGAPTFVISEDWYYIINALNSLIVLPLQNAGDTAWFVFIIYGLCTFFFFFGIHGPNTLSPIIAPIFVAAILHNVDVLEAFGSSIPAALESGELLTFTNQTAEQFLTMGGTGATFGLMLALWVFSKSPSSSTVNKVATAPCAFNINEPYIFGLPIMLNPVYALPFILLEPFVGVGVYLITAAGWLNPTMFYIPWTVPPVIGGIVCTADYRAFFVCVSIILISFLVYTPSVLLDARSQIKKQLAEGENKDYHDLVDKLDETRKELSINLEDQKLIDEKNELKLKIRMIEDETSEKASFNIKANEEGKYRPLGEELIIKKYKLIFKSKFEKDLEKDEIKKQLKPITTELKILGKEAKCDTKIFESNEYLLNKKTILEEKKDLNTAKINEKITQLEEKINIKFNKLEVKTKINDKKLQNEINLIKNQELEEEIKIDKINSLKKEILESKQNVKIEQEKLQKSKLNKVTILKEKIEKNEAEVKNTFDKLTLKNQNFVKKMEIKISNIKEKKEIKLKKFN